MTALLVQPRAMRWFWQWSPPPLGLLSMAAAAPGTRVIDCAQSGQEEADVIADHRPDIVGVTAFTSTRHEALAVLEAAKAAGARTVLGGPHVSARNIAEQVAQHYPFVDHVIRGDGERAWARLVAGESLPRVSLEYLPDLDALPVPAWGQVPVMEYAPRDSGIYQGVDLETTPRISIVVSRGCPGRCAFCRAWKRPMRRHSAAWVRRALEPLADMGVRHICIDDDCWATDAANALEICDVLSDLGFVWQATTRADLITAELAEYMAAAGCWQVAVGLESGSRHVLDLIGKRLDLDAVLTARRACWDAGLRFNALTMTGYPGETDDDRREHAAFMARLDADDTGTLGVTVILPGTQLYSEAVAAGQISDDIWLGPGRHLIATPEGPRMWSEA